MPAKKDYLIEVYGKPQRTWLAAESDEDETERGTPPVTTDQDLAVPFEKFNDARNACKAAAKRFPTHSFRVGVSD